MYETAEVFVDSQAPIEDFVKELEPLLEIKFKRQAMDYSENELRQSMDKTYYYCKVMTEIWYEFSDPHVALTVAEHDLRNDRDMKFEDYRYCIAVRGFNSWEERKKWREEFAHVVFQKLKATQRYRLLMTDNIQMRGGIVKKWGNEFRWCILLLRANKSWARHPARRRPHHESA
jgi:hypothetical protein